MDAYFSGTKITHLLDTIGGLRTRAERGELLFGTVDSWLLWRLTGGRVHATDYSNASRTLLYNIHTLDWDDELLRILGVPRAMLPEVRSSSEVYGQTAEEWLGGAVPIAAVAGDQQAATFGQACFSPGMAKNTYGTGCFLLMNTGGAPIESRHRMLTTIGWGIGGQITYCLEGSVFIGGAVVQWLRDGLGLIRSSAEVEKLAAQVSDTGTSTSCRRSSAWRALLGPFRPRHDHGADAGNNGCPSRAAALESMAFQTRDVLEAMQKDAGIALAELKVDGGASVNHLLMQFQADVLGVHVRRPVVAETTALGAAYLAGLAVGYWDDLEELKRNWAVQCEYRPQMPVDQRDARYARWRKAVVRSLGWAE